MNTNNIKRYAPKARTAFIAAMTKRAALFGIRNSSIPSMGIEPLEQKGDLALIGDRPFPASIIRPRAALVKKVEQMGFAQAMEQAAYSWFNRLCAIRYMELKGYLDHGRRVLSHPDQPGSFQILDDCLDVELEGLDRQRITELKLDGTKDEELYRELLLAQCHAMHQAMPFLFEAVDDATELLLPDNLTKTDSLIRELVSAIPEEDWQDVEIIGWLYQFYISDKKDQVIGKVVKSEDIPAATQLFTPNWIVQYLVQNSVGRQWLQTYPDSPLKAKMPYYIEPAEQTPEVQAKLTAVTADSIDPLSIKVLDPACGSGHILVEAYKVLKAIYEERGFRSRDIPQLILENNLFGLDIDDRAGQLAGFALMMLAREDDRRIFSREVKLNVLSLQESRHLDFASLWKALNLASDWLRGQSQNLFDIEQTDLGAAQADNRYQLLKTTLARFTEVKTFGSLIEVPAENAEPLAELLGQLRQLAHEGDVMQKPAAEQLIPSVLQAWVLAQRYDAVVANPPYMGSGGMNSALKEFAKHTFPDSKTDLFSIYIERCLALSKKSSEIALVTPYVWMFIGSYEKVREKVIRNHTLKSLIQLEYNAFAPACIPVCAYIIGKQHVPSYKGSYIRLSEFKGHESQAPKTLEAIQNKDCGWFYETMPDNFKMIPGAPVGYWISEKTFKIFSQNKKLREICYAGFGIKTGNNDIFMREWHEISLEKLERNQRASDKINKKWYPCASGGNYRKWYGNQNLVVNYENSGSDIKSHSEVNGNSFGFNGASYYFKKSITWPKLTSSANSFRSTPEGNIFDGVGLSAFFENDSQYYMALGLLNTELYKQLIAVVAPTLSFTTGDFLKLPYPKLESAEVIDATSKLVELHKKDWDLYERSFNFSNSPLLSRSTTLHSAYKEILNSWEAATEEAKTLESKLNLEVCRIFDIEELTQNIQDDQITLTTNPAYRYSGDQNISEKNDRLQSETLSEFVSYTIGCILGRYSLDREGLVYAHNGNQGFAELVAEGAYKTFPADSDGILPLTNQEWFADDATNRFREFIRTVWGEEQLPENLDFVAESLCLYAIKPKRGESALDTIRRYLSTKFYKDHLKTYKKRPIYWLFSSGKHKAFECLVYLHRYNEGTLARMRTEYVIPLTAKLNTYANKLATDIENETVTSEKKRLEKELATLHNQQAELATFDEKLRHYADQRISLDLDEGVKVNYGKFGDLLAEVKAVTGDKGD